MWSIFQSIKRSWSQHFVGQFSALVVMFMTYMALLFIALSLINVENFFDTWGQVNKMSIYLKPDANAEDRKSIEVYLKSQELINNVETISSEKSAKNFEERFSKVSSQKINPEKLAKFFPEFYVANLNQRLAYKTSSGVLDQFVSQFMETFTSVKNISYGKNWLQRYVGILSAVRTIGWFFILAFLIATLVVSASVIKTTLYSRRDEIEIMEFIGADDLEIYLPQILNALFLSSLAFLMALFTIAVSYLQIKVDGVGYLSSATLSQLSFISPLMILGLFITSAISVVAYSVYTIFKLLPRRKQALLVNGVVK